MPAKVAATPLQSPSPGRGRGRLHAPGQIKKAARAPAPAAAPAAILPVAPAPPEADPALAPARATARRPGRTATTTSRSPHPHRIGAMRIGDHHRLGHLRAARASRRRAAGGRDALRPGARDAAASSRAPRCCTSRATARAIARLSSAVTHQANIARAARARRAGVLAVTVCGAARPDARARLAGRLRRPALPRQPAAGRLAVHAAHRARRCAGRGHWIFDGPFSAAAARGAARGGARGRPSGARRRLLRPRRRAALQHARGDPHADGGRRDRRLADGRARDRARGRGRAPVRAARLRDRLRQRRQARRADAGRGAGAPDRASRRRPSPASLAAAVPRVGARRPRAGRAPISASTDPAALSSPRCAAPRRPGARRRARRRARRAPFASLLAEPRAGVGAGARPPALHAPSSTAAPRRVAVLDGHAGPVLLVARRRARPRRPAGLAWRSPISPRAPGSRWRRPPTAARS